MNKQYVIDEKNQDLHRCGLLAGMFIRPFTIEKVGERLFGHSHWIDHIGNLVRGQVRIHWRKEDGTDSGTVDVLVAAKVLIKKDCWHEVEALTDNVLWECWFSAAEAEEDYGDANAIPWMQGRATGG